MTNEGMVAEEVSNRATPTEYEQEAHIRGQ